MHCHYRRYNTVGDCCMRSYAITANCILWCAAAAKENYSDCDCLAIAVLTHGDAGGMLYGIDGTHATDADAAVAGNSGSISVDRLLEPIKTCKSLFGKPKLVFIQVHYVFCFVHAMFRFTKEQTTCPRSCSPHKLCLCNAMHNITHYLIVIHMLFGTE